MSDAVKGENDFEVNFNFEKSNTGSQVSDEQKLLQEKLSRQCSSCSNGSGSSSSSSSSRRHCIQIIFCIFISIIALALSIFNTSLHVIYLQQEQGKVEPVFATFVIDLSHTRSCGAKLGNAKLPCKSNMKFVTNEDRLGPLRCHNDTRWNKNFKCNDKVKLKIHSDGKGIVMPEDGDYSVHVIMTFYDEIDRYVSASLRIDYHDAPKCQGSHVCERRRNEAAHTWLSCFNHNHHSNAGGRQSVDFSTCTMTGIRRFTAGDVLSVAVGEKYRSLNAFYKASYIVIRKL